MYKGFTKMDISELFPKDSHFKGTVGPHIEVGEARFGIMSKTVNWEFLDTVK